MEELLKEFSYEHPGEFVWELLGELFWELPEEFPEDLVQDSPEELWSKSWTPEEFLRKFLRGNPDGIFKEFLKRELSEETAGRVPA